MNIKLYGDFEPASDIEDLFCDKCKYYLTDVSEKFGVTVEHLAPAIYQAEKAFSRLNIPLNYHFKDIFRSDGSINFLDMRLSAFAVSLILMHADPENERIAAFQLHFAGKQAEPLFD
jgi:hypothetical protein